MAGIDDSGLQVESQPGPVCWLGLREGSMRHDESNVNIVLSIIIIIITIIITKITIIIPRFPCVTKFYFC